MITEGRTTSATKTDALQHPMFARFYMRLAGLAERLGAAEHRTRLLAGLAGQVIEVGAGHGPYFRHYPSTVRACLPSSQRTRCAPTHSRPPRTRR